MLLNNQTCFPAAITTGHVTPPESVQVSALFLTDSDGNILPSSLLRGVCGGSKAGCTLTVIGRGNKAPENRALLGGALPDEISRSAIISDRSPPRKQIEILDEREGFCELFCDSWRWQAEGVVEPSEVEGNVTDVRRGGKRSVCAKETKGSTSLS